MKILLITFLFLITSTSAIAANNWSYMACSGVDGSGKSVYVTAHSDIPTVTINGDTFRIMGKTRNGLGVFTETFITVSGAVVYDSLVPISSNALNIYQFNAVTEVLLAQATLSCTFYGNSGLSTLDQPIFSSLKKAV